jgi:hypothetical protein
MPTPIRGRDRKIIIIGCHLVARHVSIEWDAVRSGPADSDPKGFVVLHKSSW